MNFGINNIGRGIKFNNYTFKISIQLTNDFKLELFYLLEDYIINTTPN